MVSVEGSMNESSKATEAASYATTASEAWTWDASQLAELNRHLDKPFGEVELFNQCLAFALWQSGYKIDYRHESGQWLWFERGHRPEWNAALIYRILPKPKPLVLPSIDWSHVQPIWKWLVQDKFETPLLFAEKPETMGYRWEVKEAPRLLATHFASFKPGTGDWKKLIVQRPEGV